MKKGKLVALTGAGISAESGLRTFRDSDGLWEEHRIEDVATPEAWARDMDLVLTFYDQRRIQLGTVEPNEAHLTLASLQEAWDLTVITQNVDDLHERGGAKDVLHLHGELVKARSSVHPDEVYHIGYEMLEKGQTCTSGQQLRPHVVWFGESVPLIEEAHAIVSTADMVLIIGTSLNVYPAAGLKHSAPKDCPIIVIDPDPEMKELEGGRLRVITKKATSGMTEVAAMLLK